MPWPTTACAGTPCSDAPRNCSTPFDGCEREMAFSSVLLPAPFGPSTATNSPSPTASDTSSSASALPYETDRLRISSSMAGCVGADLVVAADVGLDHGRMADDVVGQALGDDLAEVERDDAVDQAHELAQLVLDQDDREAFVGVHLADQRRQVGDLGAAEAGEGLVEKEQRGLGGERAGDLEAALIAVRE